MMAELLNGIFGAREKQYAVLESVCWEDASRLSVSFHLELGEPYLL